MHAWNSFTSCRQRQTCPVRANNGSGSSYIGSLLPSNCHGCQLMPKVTGPRFFVLPPWLINLHGNLILLLMMYDLSYCFFVCTWYLTLYFNPLKHFWQFVLIVLYCIILPSVHWRCSLGGVKGIRPVKELSGEVLTWSGYLSERGAKDLHMVQLMPPHYLLLQQNPDWKKAVKLVATLCGSRPGVQSASLIMTSLMTS